MAHRGRPTATTRSHAARITSAFLAVALCLALACEQDSAPTPPVEERCATPIFAPPPGTHSASVSLSITSATAGAVIRFTTDGSEPTASSETYADPLVLAVSTTVKAKAWKEGLTESLTATGEYAITASCALSLAYPTGGETWPEGETRAIRWDGSGCAGPILILLLHDGAVCDTISADASNSGAFDWMARPCAGAETGYAIRLIDPATGSRDESGADFSILAPCALRLDAPAGGEKWTAGESVEILWASSASCGGSARIELVLDGAVCAAIADSAPGGRYSWPVRPCGERTEGYAVRVTDRTSLAAVTSPATITITSPSCPMTILSPGAHDAWEEGTAHEILWSSQGCADSVRIELLLEGEPCAMLAAAAPNSGRFSWTALRCGPAEDGYAVRITDLSDPLRAAVGEPFTIPSAPPACRLTVTSPLDGERWVAGETRSIRWASDGCGPALRIELLHDGTLCALIADEAANDGAEDWIVEPCAGAGGGYAIRIADPSTGGSGASAGSFTIAGAACAITLRAPAGGESWQEGTVYEILWSSSDCAGPVRIELMLGDAVCATLAPETADTGSFFWTALRCGETADGYRIRVTDIPSATAAVSDAPFSIPAPPPCAPRVVFPASGALYPEGATVAIAWTPSPCDSAVAIDLLRDGAPCAAIAGATANDGDYAWAARRCGEAEDGYAIRVRGTASGDYGDGDGSFTILGPCLIGVSFPAGGEVLAAGSAYEIRWSASRACGPTVRVELLLDGAVCLTIAESAPNDGRFEWNAGGCGGRQDGYAIRVTDLASGSSDESEGTFSIPACALAVTSPEGGERWPRGSAQAITWTSSGCGGTVRIELLCQGSPCLTIADAAPDDGSYPWSAAICCDDVCGHTIRVTDLSTGASDASDAPFCVCPPCAIQVTSPNGGESWKEGTSHEIEWSAADCAGDVRIELVKGGSACIVVAAATPNDGSYTWSAENCGSADGYTIRISDPCGASDASDGAFSIPECRVDLASPNGGERIAPGSAQEIAWTSSGCAGNVRIELLQTGSVCSTIIADTPDDGGFLWTAAPCGANGCGYRLRVTNLETGSRDESDGDFCICPPCQTTVTSPNGGESWEESTAHEIVWIPAADCDAAVSIELLRLGTLCSTIAQSTANDGSFLWTAARCAAETEGYSIRVTGLACGATDTGDAPFSIPPPHCAVTLAAPDGGETWLAGTQHEIAWSAAGDCGASVRLELLRDGIPCSNLTDATANDGSFLWTAQPCDGGATGYTVRVTDLASDASDESDGTFMIPTCSLLVTAPDGGEVWQEGSSQTITWSSSNCGGTARIELLRDGILCATITGGTPDDGSYPWTPLRCDGVETGYQVRIVDIATGVTDESGAAFTIAAPPCLPVLTSPNGGETWQEGTPRTVAWSAPHCDGPVRLELLHDGSVCRTIVSETPNDGAHTWNPERCGTATAGYRIRIIDLPSSTDDESDGDFSIECAPCPFAVTSPAGGEQWQEGSVREIRWSPAACDLSVRITLLLNGAPCDTIAADTPDDGSFLWTAARCGADANGYRVRITGLTCGRSAESASSFSIPPIPDLYFLPSGLTFCAGDQNVEILIYGRNSQAIKGYGVNLCFDPAVFECVDLLREGTRGEDAVAFEKLCAASCARAGLIYSASCPPQIDPGEGVLLRLIVNVRGNAPVGPTLLDLGDVDPAYNVMTLCSGAGLNPALQDATVEICAGRPPAGARRESDR